MRQALRIVAGGDMGLAWCGRLARLAAVLGVLLSPSWALGQASRGQSAVPTPQQLNPAVVGRGASAVDNLLMAPEPGPCPLRGSNLTFVLKAVEFTGAEGVKPARLS